MRRARAISLLILGALIVPLMVSGCSGPQISPDGTGSFKAAKECKPDDIKGRLSPFLIDEESSGLRQDLEGVLKTRGLAVIRATCDKGIEVLEGCFVRGEYSFVGLSTKDKTLVMKDEAKAAANLGFGLGQGLSAAFSAGRELVLQYRLVGKYKTTVPGVVRGQLSSATCAGATHVVTSVDVGAFSSFTASRGAFSASGNFAGKGGSAEGSTEQSDKNTAGDFESCPTKSAENFQAKSGKPSDECSASIRVSMAPIIEADSVSVLGSSRRIQKETDCRKGFVLNNDEICVPREEAKVFLCEPTNYEECRKMCVEPDDKNYNKKSCGRLANLLMQHIMEAYEDMAQADTKKTSRLEILQQIVDEDANPFVFEAVNDYGTRLTEVCKELADGNTCALATIYKLITVDQLKPPENATEEQLKAFMGKVMSEIYGLIRKGCQAGEQFSCEAMEIILYDEDNGELRDPAIDAFKIHSLHREFIAAITSSCDNGNSFSCFRLSKEHVRGQKAFLDITKAADFAQRSCYGGLSHACIASAAMKLKNGDLCNNLLAQYKSESDDEMEEADEDDPFTQSMTLEKEFTTLICKKSGKDAETTEVALSALLDSFDVFATGCELGDTAACRMSEDLYAYIVEREVQRIEIQDRLRKGGDDDEE